MGRCAVFKLHPSYFKLLKGAGGMSWQKMRLGSFLTLKRGYDLPSSNRQKGEVPVVSSSGITGHHSVAKVEGPGVVTGRYGTLGEVFFVQQDFWPLNTALYVHLRKMPAINRQSRPESGIERKNAPMLTKNELKKHYKKPALRITPQTWSNKTS